jgi:subtilase family serine protease
VKYAGFRALLCALFVTAGAAATASAAPFHTQFPGAWAQPPTTQECIDTTAAHVACYGPAQFQQAYDMKSLYQSGLTGAGKTIVLVDSYGSPTIKADLATFDSDFGLPAPPSFRVVTPAGPVPAYNPQQNPDQPSWGVETSLDVEYAHAMAPGANIVLVETPVDETEGVQGLPQMMYSENWVIDHHIADVISQSFGATEETFPSARSVYDLRGAFYNALQHRVTVLGSSGDGGPTDQDTDLVDYFPFRVNSWPSADPLVTSVGGTQLHLDQNGNRLAPDNVWNDTALFGSPAASGGGLSKFFSQPFYQDGVGGIVDGRRGTPDVSMSAAVNGGALVYYSFTGTGAYHIVGGTSEASPLFSGIVAIADQAAHRDLGLLDPALYGLGDSGGSGLVDVTGGNTTVSGDNGGGEYNGPFTVDGYPADTGYDLATGLGTADGAKLVAELAGSNSHRRGHRSPRRRG